MTQSSGPESELARFEAELGAESEAHYRMFQDALEAFRNWSNRGWLPSELGQLTIWDVGCGSGEREAVFYFNGCRNILGLDIARAEIPRAIRSLPGIRFEIGPLADAKGEAKPDLITAFTVTEHVANLPAFCLDCYKALRPGGVFFLAHDNYYQPVGHHDHGFLFLDSQTNSVRFQGTACWETEEKCSASERHRQTLLRSYPHCWSRAFEAELTPFDCSFCRYKKRAQPWAHLVFQNEFNRLFPGFFSTGAGALNKVTLHQLRQWLIEAGFKIEHWIGHFLSNEVPPDLLETFQKNDLLTFQLIGSARKTRVSSASP